MSTKNYYLEKREEMFDLIPVESLKILDMG